MWFSVCFLSTLILHSGCCNLCGCCPHFTFHKCQQGILLCRCNQWSQWAGRPGAKRPCLRGALRAVLTRRRLRYEKKNNAAVYSWTLHGESPLHASQQIGLFRKWCKQTSDPVDIYIYFFTFIQCWILDVLHLLWNTIVTRRLQRCSVRPSNKKKSRF